MQSTEPRDRHKVVSNTYAVLLPQLRSGHSKHQVKVRHGKLLSQYHLCVMGQHGVLCEVKCLKIRLVIQIKLSQLV